MKERKIQIGLIAIVGSLFLTSCQSIKAAKVEESVSYSDAKLQRFAHALDTENQEELVRLSKEVKGELPKKEFTEVKKSTEVLGKATEKKVTTSPKKEKVEYKMEHMTVEQKQVLPKKEKQVIKEEKKEDTKANPKLMVSSKKILMVGDSVMEGSKAQLKKMYPNAIIDSAVSRQFTVLPDILKKAKAEHGDLPEIVVIHLGSNGSYGEKQMQETMQILGKRKVFFLNTKVEKPWQNPVNEFLQAQVAKYPNAKLVNWYQTSKDGDYFAKDGVHPNKTGAQVYRNLIQRTLEKEL